MERFFWPGVVASLAVHGVVLGSLLTRDFVIALPAETQREYVEISFAKRAPPPPQPVPLSEETSAPPPASADVAPAVAEAPAPEKARPRPAIAAPGSAPAPLIGTDTAEQLGQAGSGATLNRDLLSNQVTAFVRQQRDSYTGDFVNDCWIKREEGEQRECDGAVASDKGGDAQARGQVTALFRDFTRNERHARLTAEFETRNEQLKEIAAGGGVLGTLAAERRSINNEYRAYLNGNRNSAASNYVMSAFANTGGNLQAMGGFLQFTCKKMPCIYEFTGFSVVKPEELEEAEAKTDSFPYTPTLFGSRK